MHPISCPECQGDLKHHGSLKRNYVEAPVRGQKVALTVDRRRYRCENGHAPQQPLDDCVDGRQLTVRALRYIEHESVRASMGSTAKRIGVSDKTVRDVCADFFERLSASRVPVSVKRLELVKIVLGGVDSILLVDRDSGRFLDLAPQAEWVRMASAFLESACYPGMIESVYGPGELLQYGGLRSIEQEMLPTAPSILDAIGEIADASKQVGFSTARARVHLWSDPMLHARIIRRGFLARCDCCLASCLEDELASIRVKTAASGKPEWRQMRLCTACRGFRTPVWFNFADDDSM